MAYRGSERKCEHSARVIECFQTPAERYEPDDWTADFPGVALPQLSGYAPWIDPMTCPDGCTTTPLGTKEKAAARSELNNHIAARDSCNAVKNDVLNKITAGSVRKFEAAQDTSSWGDIHWKNRNIHIRSDAFGQPHELGMTLMHEGYHDFYTSRDDVAAEAFAASCVTN